jgi:hypothetical protein
MAVQRHNDAAIFVLFADYFRLFAASDLFMALCPVPRHHRDRRIDRAGGALANTSAYKGLQHVLIRDLQFLLEAAALLKQRLDRFQISAPITPETS